MIIDLNSNIKNLKLKRIDRKYPSEKATKKERRLNKIVKIL